MQSQKTFGFSHSRRKFIRYTSLASFYLLRLSVFGAESSSVPSKVQQFKGQQVLNRILSKASAQDWRKLPIGEVVGKVAMELQGTACIGSTLEISKDIESCVVNLNGFDCVTFFENALCMARMIKRGKNKPEDLLAEVQYTRYRGGKMGDYTTRLHYTTDWLVDNEKKGVIKILTPTLPGAQPFTQKVGVMSQHPIHYRQLTAHPEYLPKIKQIEDEINARSLKYVPLSRIVSAEPLLQTGDIVGVTTTQQGIDIAHVGLCMKDSQRIIHFLDASTVPGKMRVTLEGDIARSFNWSSKLTGAMFARPLELT